MSELRVMRLAARREVRARRKAFLVSTLILVLITAGGMVALALLAPDDGWTARVGLAGETPGDLEGLITAGLPDDADLEIVRLSDASSAEVAVLDGTVDVAVMDGREMLTRGDSPQTVSGAVTSALGTHHLMAQGSQLGLTPAELQSLLDPSITVTELEDPEASSVGDEVLGAIAMIVLFIAILTYGQWIALGVVEEKTNRVVELLLGAITPRHLLIAKVVTIGSLGLVQLMAMGAVVVAAGLVAGVELPPVTGAAVGWILLWFLLGYAFYGLLYAAAGSLAADSQEASNVIGPLSVVLVVGYMAGWTSLPMQGETVVIRILSWIPLWSPIVMPTRIVRGWAPGWEVAVIVLLMLAAVYGMLRLAGRIYVGGVARSSSTLGWREAFRQGRDLQSVSR